jgi:prepilin-type N-terminal cleavage/methylation domain-containing protein
MDRKIFGFTLVELMVTVVIFLLLIGAVVLVFIVGRASWGIAEAHLQVHQELRRGMDWMTEELRQGGASTITNVPADGVWYNTIAFRKPQDVISGNVVWEDNQTQYLRGGLEGRQLLRMLGSEQMVLANDIILFQVRRQQVSPAIVEIALEAQRTTARGNLIDANLNFQLKLRN